MKFHLKKRKNNTQYIKVEIVSEKEIENIVNTLAKQVEKDYNSEEFTMIGLPKDRVNIKEGISDFSSRGIALSIHKCKVKNNNIMRSDTHWIIRKRYAICFFI